MAASDAFELARARAMILGYDARWLSTMADLEVLAVEVEFRAPLVNPETGAPSRTYRRGGKIDAFVRRRSDDRKVLVEHKSSGEDLSPGSPYWRHLALDSQISTYYEGAKALGWDVDECMYDVLGKIALRPYKATPEEKRKYKADGTLYANMRERDETPEEYLARCIEALAGEPEAYFRRGAIVRLEEEVRDALWDDWQVANQLREATRAGHFPRNPDACFKWGRVCTFFDVCTGVASLDDRTRFVRSDHVSPELAQDAPGGLPVLSNSRLKSARACQRLHKYQYIDGYRPKEEPEPLRFGSLIHRALEAWWTAPEDPERLPAALAALDAAGESIDQPTTHAA